MHRRVFGALSILALGPIALAEAGDAGAPAMSAQGPIVLELFTSQGCSSCPPAERVLSRLGMDEESRGRIIPLAFHVDYWDAGGWVDPFSAPAWTARQAAYDQALGNGMFTPQLVVNGRAQFPGGNEARARSEIAAARERTPAARVGLSVRKGEGQPGKVTVDVTAELIEAVSARKLQVLVALFESRLATAVTRGENAGSRLEGEYVVRRLDTALSLDPKPGARKQASVAFKLERAWNPEHFGVAAFVQDPVTMRIYGATSLASLD